MVLKQCGVWYENSTNSGEKKEFWNISRQENCEEEIEIHFLSRNF